MTSPTLAAPSARPRAMGNVFAAASMVVWAAGFPAAEALPRLLWKPLPGSSAVLVKMGWGVASAVAFGM